MAQDEAKASASNEVDEGVQAFRQAHYDDAIARFEQAVAFDPDLVVARIIWPQPICRCLSREWIPRKMLFWRRERWNSIQKYCAAILLTLSPLRACLPEIAVERV